MILLGSFVVGMSRFFGRIEASQEERMSVAHYHAAPPFRLFVPIDSFVLPLGGLGIANVLSMGTWAKILFPIIESIAVFVVNLFPRRALDDLSMHSERFTVRSADYIERVRFWTEHCHPVPLREPFKILHINDGVLILRQRNQTVGFVQRLSDFVSYHTRFWHVPPRIGCATQPPFYQLLGGRA